MGSSLSGSTSFHQGHEGHPGNMPVSTEVLGCPAGQGRTAYSVGDKVTLGGQGSSWTLKEAGRGNDPGSSL